MTNVESISYEVSDTKVRFHEVTIENQSNDDWVYTKPGPWLSEAKGKSIGLLYNKFLEKVNSLKEKKLLQKTDTILCNAGYAAELFIKGVITQEMVNSIEEGVAGAGRDMTAIITIPKQKIMISDQEVETSIMIVNCFSYKTITFIDKDDNNLI